MKLDFTIDALTNSIVRVATNEHFETEISLLEQHELKDLTKKNGWRFNWKREFRDNKGGVYKLAIAGNTLIEGLISLELKADHVYIRLLENAFRNIGHGQMFKGVAGNLVAYACLCSSRYGFDGVVSFDSKTNLITYRSSLGAVLLGNQRMAIFEKEAALLITQYFAGYDTI